MTVKQSRETAFDALRVYLLFLGFIFHSLLSYTETAIAELWPYKDTEHTILFDGIVIIILCFRMPTFFFISGYFVEKMLFEQKPFPVFKKRMFRLGIPLCLALLICFPIVNLGFILSNGVYKGLTIDSVFPIFESVGGRIHTTYLWFLYYLLIFSFIHTVLPRNNKHLEKYKNRFPVFLILISMIVLMMTILFFVKQNVLHGFYSFRPELFSLAGFFVFYFAGILFARNNVFLKKISENFVILTISAVIVLPIYLYIASKSKMITTCDSDYSIEMEFMYSLLSVILTFLTLGLFLRFYKVNILWIKYLSDSSYFLYIIHLPIIVLIVAFLSNYALSAGIKFGIVLTTSIFISLIFNFLRIRFLSFLQHCRNFIF